MRLISATGHRPETLPKTANIEKVMKAIHDFIFALRQEDVHWNTCGQRGADLWIAEAALVVGHSVDVFLPFPVEIFTQKWQGTRDVMRLKAVINRARKVHVIGDRYDVSNYGKRDRASVDAGHELFSLWDRRSKGGTALTTNYALKQGKELMIMDPITCEVRFEA